MAVYGYTRVSTLRAADEGASLDAQERCLAGYAMMHEMGAPVMFIERGVTGSVPLHDRPQGKRLLDALEPGDIVLTPKLDRMFRSARDALAVLDDLKARGISLHMIDLGGDVTSNGISKLVFTILSAVAEAERDRIRERIIGVKQDQKAQGLYLGGTVPYGFTVEDARLVPVPELADKIAQVKALRDQGLSLRKIEAATGVTINSIRTILA